MWLAERVSTQKRRDPLPKVYSLHAPAVECIGKGKAHKPYEFGCKVSVAATNSRPPGGQFVAHVKAFHGNPYDGHTLRQVIEEMERWTGISAERIYVDKGYQGHDYPNKHRVFRSGQKRGITPTIKKELRRRSAVEVVIGHLKSDGRLGRNFLRRLRRGGGSVRLPVRDDRRLVSARGWSDGLVGGDVRTPLTLEPLEQGRAAEAPLFADAAAGNLPPVGDLCAPNPTGGVCRTGFRSGRGGGNDAEVSLSVIGRVHGFAVKGPCRSSPKSYRSVPMWYL